MLLYLMAPKLMQMTNHAIACTPEVATHVEPKLTLSHVSRTVDGEYAQLQHA
jgi:hypothetical protein